MKNDAKNAVFLQRLFAFLIDCMLIIFCVYTLTGSFVNVSAIEKINNQIQDIMIKLQNSEIGYMSSIKEIAVLELAAGKLNGIVTIFMIVCEILYFVVFQIYNSGQTIGKKLLKIKVVSKTGELTMNQMILRSFLVNSLLLNMILITVVTFVNNPINYLYTMGCFEFMQFIFYLITAFMIMLRKDHVSLHDIITNTKVVKLLKEDIK